MTWWKGIVAGVALGASVQATQACDLALVLAVDVSGSVDTEEYKIQMQGLAEALRDGAISEALVVREAAVQVIQWTGTGRHRVSVPWTRIRTFDDTDLLADEIENDQRIWRNFSTALGEAVRFAQRSFDAVPDCARRVIDVSGDGRSNEGIRPPELHASLLADGIIVNGLAIEAYDKGLTAYFEEQLIVGPGAFAMRAATFKEYPDRIRRKLLREITKQVSALDVGDDSGRL
jgi:Ca-activated chloride channel family protein